MTEKFRPETRVYPACCTSAFCGRLDCSGCENLPVLEAFQLWVRSTRAKVSDPIWSPTVYVTTKPEEKE